MWWKDRLLRIRSFIWRVILFLWIPDLPRLFIGISGRICVSVARLIKTIIFVISSEKFAMTVEHVFVLTFSLRANHPILGLYYQVKGFLLVTPTVDSFQNARTSCWGYPLSEVQNTVRTLLNSYLLHTRSFHSSLLVRQKFFSCIFCSLIVFNKSLLDKGRLLGWYLVSVQKREGSVRFLSL